MYKTFLPLSTAFVLCSTLTNANAQSYDYSRENFTSAAESTVNGVVSVKSYATPSARQQYNNQDFFSDPFFEFFFGQPMQPRQQPRQQEKPAQRQIGLGSGVIISPEGYIVTNNHVIADAEKLEVTLNDNRNYTATVIGTDPNTDLALIKIDAEDLHVIPVGDSENLKVGEWVLAVGNPFGFTSTVTAGIVSAKARNISTTTGARGSGGIESYIQTDAAVNQGNSGGALVNLKGELVGINTAIYSQNGSYIGCSFAIPTTIVSKVIADLKEFGTVQRAYLGIRFAELTPELIAEKKLSGVTSGIWVDSVEDRSAAREAGIESGDVIISLDNHPTHSTAQLQEAIARLSPGDTALLTIIRDGKQMSKNVTLRNRQGETSVVKPGTVNQLGATFRELTEEEKTQYEVRSGVIVDSVSEGYFRKSGVPNGTVIQSINGISVNSANDVEKIYQSIISGDSDKVMFIKAVKPDGKQTFYAVSLIE